MPSPTLAAYRRQLEEQGLFDDRDEDAIIVQLGEVASQENPDLFKQDPELASRYVELREANAPSLGGEVSNAAKRASYGLLSTALSGASLLTGEGWIRNKSKDFANAAGAPELRSTIPDLESIAPDENTKFGKTFSRDALRYGLSKVGEVVPSAVEAGLTAVAGGLVGSAVAPGPGTIAGAVAGRGLIRAAIKRLATKELTEEAIEAGLKAEVPDIIEKVSRAASAIGGQRGITTASALNSWLLGAGDVRSEIPDSPGLAAALGLVAAVPDTILPTLVVRRMFPGVATAVAKEAAKEEVATKAVQLAKKIGIGAAAIGGEGTTEWFQESVNVVARNIEEGKDPLTFTDEDYKRFREAGITGMFGGALASPALMFGGKRAPDATDETVPPPAAAVPEAVAAAPAPAAPVARTRADILSAVGAMAPEEQVKRLAELQAKLTPTPDETVELTMLQATAPVAPSAPAAVTAPTPAPTSAPGASVAPVAPAEPATAAAAPIEQPEPLYTKEEQDKILRTLPNLNPAELWAVSEGKYTAKDLSDKLSEASDEVQASTSQGRTVGDSDHRRAVDRQSLYHNAFQRQSAREAVVAPPSSPVASVAPVAPEIPAPPTPAGSENTTFDPAHGREIPAPPVPVVAPVVAPPVPQPTQVVEPSPPVEDFPGSERDRERQATALGNNPKELEQRLRDGAMKLRGVKSLKGWVFDPELKTLTSPEGTGVKWQLRSNPSAPISYENQQTSVGSVSAYRKTGPSDDAQPLTQDPAAPTPEAPVPVQPPAPEAAAAPEPENFSGPPENEAPPAVRPIVPSTGIVPPPADAKSAEIDAVADVAAARLHPPFRYGNVTGSLPTQDFRDLGEATPAAPEGWSKILRRSLLEGVRGDKKGNRAVTRVGLVLQNPAGEVVMAGVVRPQSILRADGTTALNEPALQHMGTGKNKDRTVMAGGDLPAVATDVFRSGWQPVALIQFDGEATDIFERYPNLAAYDATFAATKATVATRGGPLAAPTLGGPDLYSRARRAKQTQVQIEAEIDAQLKAWDKANKEERTAIEVKLIDLYDQQEKINDIAFRQVQDAQRLPATAAQAHAFQQGVKRLQSLGGKVDLYAKEFFAQGVTAEIEKRIAALEAALPGASPAQQYEINQKIGYLRDRVADVGKAQGVTFSPHHMAIAMEDSLDGDLTSLVTLLHEAAEQLAQQLNPSVRGKISKAADRAIGKLRERADAAREKTGVPLSVETSAVDRLTETLAQELVAEGIQDAPSLAQAIVRWVKDLYYRTLMALQASFGGEPSDKATLDWFENQLRRNLHGDYDLRIAHLFNRYLPVPMHERVRRFKGRRGSTPGGVADYYNPFSQKIEQPSVLSTTAEALAFNVEFQTGGLAIPSPEARARERIAAVNKVREVMEKIYADSKSSLPWPEWWGIVGAGEEDPRTIPTSQEKLWPGISATKIGGEKMTGPMNTEAAREARQILERIEFKAQEKAVKMKEDADLAAGEALELADEVNRIEGDRRDAQLQVGILHKKLKKQVQKFIKDYSSGLTGSVKLGRLAEAVRQEEKLIDSDPVPENYQAVFKAILDGKVPIWDYMQEIARLELPLWDLTRAELRKAIRDNAETNATLQHLTQNKPLLVALSELALSESDQMDDIAFALFRDAERYDKLHQALQKIRSASQAELNAMITTMEEKGKAATFGERIQQQYVERRRKLRNAQSMVKRSNERLAVIESSQAAISRAVETAQIEGGYALSDWQFVPGAEYREMTKGENGAWTSKTRTLQFNEDGSAKEHQVVETALARNLTYLRETQDEKKGSKIWQEVLRQTTEMLMYDMQGKYHAARATAYTKFVEPIIAALLRQGGAEGAMAAQMMNKFHRVQLQYRERLHELSQKFTHAWNAAQKASGIKDNGIFRQQIYHPISYFLNTEPGLDEDAALRQAAQMARARIPKEVAANFDATMYALIRATKEASEFLAKVAEESGLPVHDARLKSALRKALPQGFLTSMRSMDAPVVRRIIDDMHLHGGFKLEKVKDKDGKESVVKATTFDGLTTKETDRKNTPTLDGALAKIFTKGVVNDWLVPFINKGGEEVFKFNSEPIFQLDLQNAWAKADNSVLKWIDNLAATLKLEPSKGADGEIIDPLPDFRLSMLQQIDALFGTTAKLAYEATQIPNLLDPDGPKPHIMMDARVSDLLPPEFLEFHMLDTQSSGVLLAHIAHNAAFGRNGERMAAVIRNMEEKVRVKAGHYRNLKGTTETNRKGEAIIRGWDYAELKNAAQKESEIKDLRLTLGKFMSVGERGGPFDRLRGSTEVTGFLTGQAVDTARTGLLDTLSLLERPIAMRSLGPSTISSSVRGLLAFGKGGLGSILEAMNIHLFHATQTQKEAMAFLGSSRGQSWSVATADLGPGGEQGGMLDRFLLKPLRFWKFVQRKGVGSPAEQRDFPRAAPFPGMGVNNWLGQLASVANLSVQMDDLEKMVRHGIRYFQADKEAFENPSFRFKARDLGFRKWDQGVFDWWKAHAPEFQMGSLEQIVRDGMRAAAKGERLFSREQIVRLGSMTGDKLSGTTSINTMPSFLVKHPMLRTIFPLLRWPFWKMHFTHEGMKTVDGKRDYRSVMRGLAIMAMWNLPIGLAFTFMMDWYDEKMTGKKSNLPPVGGTAALPFIGPVAEAIMADRSVPDSLKAYAVRFTRAGNAYGLGSDWIAQVLSPTDAASGRRVVSLDQRILVMSQLENASRALSNAYNQDWTTTWASVWSPLLRSLGGHAALHSIDIANNLAGLDNAESRSVHRMNANAWLRSAASELDIPLRAGGSGTPTPMSAQTRQMLEAAMAGDRIGFMESYQAARKAALKVVMNDPTISRADRDKEVDRRVLSGWRARDPLTVFAHKPTDAQLNRLLGIMDDDGATDVREALRRYEQFSRLIEPNAMEQAMNRRMNRAMQPPAPPRRPVLGSLF